MLIGYGIFFVNCYKYFLTFVLLSNPDQHNKREVPSGKDMAIFFVKSSGLKIIRAIRNSLTERIGENYKSTRLTNAEVIASSTTLLWTNTTNDDKDLHLTAGKIHNLRIAAARLNGLEIPAHKTFSFWKQVGRTTSRKGYVSGRELREGCIIPAIGGGLCQLSNALYDAALKANFEITERHPHTRVIPGSLAETGRDATVFWNYIDLRFKSGNDFRIEARMDTDALIVEFRGKKNDEPLMAMPADNKILTSHDLNNCFSCGAHECTRHVKKNEAKNTIGQTGYLVDDYWPEYDDYIRDHASETDTLFIPIDGKRFRRKNYRWGQRGFKKIHKATISTLLRAYKVRNLPDEGGALQKALLKSDERLANAYHKKLTYELTHLCVMQNLLPFLYLKGSLGGRTYDVLMTRLPYQVLQHELDKAYSRHGQSKTLNDFRIDPALITAENKALAGARNIITPHSEIAEMFKDKVILLNWKIPFYEKIKERKGNAVFFPASAIGRKGAYEVREISKLLKLDLMVAGKNLEGDNFWEGLNITKPSSAWQEETSLVVMPAYIENKPRKLLEAVAYGIPVIASTFCGLKHVNGVVSLPPGNEKLWREEIEKQGVIPRAIQ
jgi:hypothetical protein